MKELKYLAFRFPFIYSFISRIEIVSSSDVPTAATDGEKIYLGRDFHRLKTKHRAAVLAHEALHVGLRHVEYAAKLEDPALFNIAADAVINYALEEMGMELPGGVVTVDYVARLLEKPVSSIVGLSAAEIYYLLKKRGVKVKRCTTDLLVGKRSGKRPSPAKPLPQPGEVAAAVKKQLQAYKGREAGALADPLLADAGYGVDWRKQLQASFAGWLRGKKRYTWAKLHRKLPSQLPGRRPHDKTPRRILVAIDASGSTVATKALNSFAAELERMQRQYKVKVEVAAWDVEAKEAKIEGGKLIVQGSYGGGTVIDSALKWILSRKPTKADAAVIMTDGEFYLENSKLAEEAARRLGAAVLLTLIRSSLPGWKEVRVG